MLHSTVSKLFPLLMANPENQHLRSFLHVHEEQVLIQTGTGYSHNKKDGKDKSETNEKG